MTKGKLNKNKKFKWGVFSIFNEKYLSFQLFSPLPSL